VQGLADILIHPQIIYIMAKKAKKIKTSKGLKLELVNPNAAGIDVSSTEMQVCVPEDRDGNNNRCFGTFTCDLYQISAWLKACKIDTVATVIEQFDRLTDHLSKYGIYRHLLGSALYEACSRRI
jgi:hypothetical protein